MLEYLSLNWKRESEFLVEMHITCRTGPLKGLSWPINETALLIGRGNSCDVQIPDEHVSSNQCKLTIVSGQPFIEVLGSTNPTLINGVPVTESRLAEGDEISISSSIFLVSTSAPAHDTKGQNSEIELEDSEKTKTLSLSEMLENSDEKKVFTSVVDVAKLFILSKDLSYVNSESELLSLIADRLTQRFEPCQIFLTTQRSNEIHELPLPLEVGAGSRKSETRTTLESTALKGSQGISHVMPIDDNMNRQWLLAPCDVTDCSQRLLVVERELQDDFSTDADLEFLVAFARAAAPYFEIVGSVEALKNENEKLRSGTAAKTIIGRSKAIKEAIEIAEKIAISDINVFIRGETGTGKELIANLIHEKSGRRTKPFLTLNCAAVQPDLFLSELFGHEQGSFTGAHKRRKGYAELADGGILFLDEVGELAQHNQAALLRFIETGKFQRVGSSEELVVDVRIVAATNRQMGEDRTNDKFRTDLFHRLSGIEIHLAPLRARTNDIEPLASYFLQRSLKIARHPISGFSDSAKKRLMNHTWPGNVRELRNCVERAVVLAKGALIEEVDLFPERYSDSEVFTVTFESPCSLSEIEEEHIRKVYEACDGNAKKTASILKIAESTLYTKLGKYSLR